MYPWKLEFSAANSANSAVGYHYRAFSLTWIAAWETVYIRKEFNSHRIGDPNMPAILLFQDSLVPRAFSFKPPGKSPGNEVVGTTIWLPWRHVKTFYFKRYVKLDELQKSRMLVSNKCDLDSSRLKLVGGDFQCIRVIFILCLLHS